MLSSSQEYLQALREGNYLRFLEWPQFIAQYYAMKNKDLDADTISNLLIFDWMNNGFCEGDVRQVVVLIALQQSELRPFSGNLDYNLVTIAGAAQQCLVYLNNQLADHVHSDKSLNLMEINQLLEEHADQSDKETFRDYLLIEMNRFDEWVEQVSAHLLFELYQQMRPVLSARAIIEEYLDYMDAERKRMDVEQHDDPLLDTRILVINRLKIYINEQMKLTVTAEHEVNEYIQKIRTMQPAEFELQYLNNLSTCISGATGTKPPSSSFTEEPLEHLKSYAISFFRLLKTPDPEPSQQLQLIASSSSQN